MRKICPTTTAPSLAGYEANWRRFQPRMNACGPIGRSFFNARRGSRSTTACLPRARPRASSAAASGARAHAAACRDRHAGSENKRLRAEHAVFYKRASDLDEHNQRITLDAIETARKLQQCQLSSRMQAMAQQADDLRDHNRLLIESATDMARAAGDSPDRLPAADGSPAIAGRHEGCGAAFL